MPQTSVISSARPHQAHPIDATRATVSVAPVMSAKRTDLGRRSGEGLRAQVGDVVAPGRDAHSWIGGGRGAGPVEARPRRDARPRVGG